MESIDINFQLNDIVEAVKAGWSITRMSSKHVRTMEQGEQGKIIDVYGENITVLCYDGNKIGRTSNMLKLIKREKIENNYEIF